jgi:1,5-anhydro-D-fructose reductase (1,5-anhydro-D-mannitol-forming)
LPQTIVPSEKLRWLVAGIGDISTKRAIPAILSEPRSTLAGIVTRNPAKAEPYGVPGWQDFARALTECPANAVYIATPVFLHAPQTIAALRAGKHVLCEKPMALNYADAEFMQQAALETGMTLGIAYYRRLYPKVARALQLIEAGVIGRPVFAEATAHAWCDFADGLRAWIADPKQSGGGPLRDVACHRIDLLSHLFGKPARVTGQRSALVQPIAVDDNATVLVEYENGVRAMIDVRWHSRVSRDEFRIRGTEGELDLTPLNGPELVHPSATEQIPAHANLTYPCVEDFVSAVLDRREPVSSARTALPTEWVMDQL